MALLLNQNLLGLIGSGLRALARKRCRGAGKTKKTDSRPIEKDTCRASGEFLRREDKTEGAGTK